MLKEAIRPSTIIGIKRLANQAKKASGITHGEALDLASKKAGFENFAHARRVLYSNDNSAANGHRLFLTYYWYERKPYRSGRETIEIRLSRPLLEICSKRGLKLERTLSRLRLAAPDHLLSDSITEHQSFARGELCKAVRALRFMEATGLEPSEYRHARKATVALDERLPKRDHSTDWNDPRTGRYIMLDEPYAAAVVSDDRAAWASRNGWHLQASTWPGIYSPGACPLFVAAAKDDAFDFGALMHQIDGLAPPVTAEHWPGVSVTGHETFISPMAVTPQDHRRARAKGTTYQVPSKTTEPYSSMWSSRRKPIGALGIPGHQEAGRMIKALLRSGARPWSVKERLETLRCTLEDWLGKEIEREELSDGDFFDVYYHEINENDPFVAVAATSVGVIDLLGQLRRKLTEAYPDCAPLRRLTGRIDTSVKFMVRSQQRDCGEDHYGG
ncbi:hypothetical protein EBBID32_2550 [Sphingobium indicum BiD32]|jgi:hypothetical protein|uniref:DUF5623 domain-containing protein n=1 Tax=Sphingobium indicum BiD32 TaxID=1301087 RepID=N1MGM6_9SPHN|nr:MULTISPECIES: DUF5623 domain-containing protein [Sphingomonadaceae]AGU69316.1 hypothetical protein pCADAB1_061 [Sphingomonas sp. ERG5]CCW15924.1 hypothetical protein EBBID32_2550 [Sphingobium indicum BiD32]